MLPANSGGHAAYQDTLYPISLYLQLYAILSRKQNIPSVHSHLLAALFAYICLKLLHLTGKFWYFPAVILPSICQYPASAVIITASAL